MTERDVTTVLLADDQALLRATFRMLLDTVPDLTVVGEAGDGAEACALARRLRPDVVVMDLRMPVLDGIAATARITRDPDLAHVRVLVLTTFETDELVVDALRAGASGFLGKGVDPAGLIAAIRTVAAGDRLLSPAATRALVERVLAEPGPSARPPNPGLADLTAREREVTILAARGLSNVEIGAALFISAATAKTHLARAMTKTGARDRAQLVVFAYEGGLVAGTR